MEALMRDLTKDQQLWFINLAMHAIWADEVIALPEFEVFQKLTSLLKESEHKYDLMRRLEDNRLDPLTKRDDIPESMLPVIYMEIINLLVCDEVLAPPEEAFLEKLAALFGFTKAYHFRLLKWAEEGLMWQSDRYKLLEGSFRQPHQRIPLHKLTEAQRIWYAEVLISAILSDGISDEYQVKLIRNALFFIQDEKAKKRLLGYVKNRMKPNLLSPPNLAPDLVHHVLLEILGIFAINEQISTKESIFLSDFIRICNLPPLLEIKAMDWCRQGMLWRQKKQALCKGAVFEKSSSSYLEQAEDRWLAHGENNSVMYRLESCFICGSHDPIRVHRLKPRSQKPMANIFGTLLYHGGMTEADDPVDFNLLRVHLCPTCLFASEDHDLFRRKKDSPVPEAFLESGFMKQWMEGSEERHRKFPMANKEINSLKPSVATVCERIELAILAARALYDASQKERWRWHQVGLHLLLAQILMDQAMEEAQTAKEQPTPGKAKTLDRSAAEEELKLAHQAAALLFEQARDNQISFRTAKILFTLALYWGDANQAVQYQDSLRKIADDNSSQISPLESSLLKATLNQMKADFDRRENFHRDHLEGFLPEVWSRHKK